MDKETEARLRMLAVKYETADFIVGDPSWFMHQVQGRQNQETMAFVASVLSYGSRKQFMPKIEYMLKASKGEMFRWVNEGLYSRDIPDSERCFYRLYTFHTMNTMLGRLQRMLNDYGSIGDYVKAKVTTGTGTAEGNAKASGRSAIVAISDYFQNCGLQGGVIPRADSACKRIVMFLRWMVRDSSPVDLGLWSDFIDKRTIFIPLDTHVMQQARQLGISDSRTQSWNAVIKITEAMKTVFPDDPAKGDFALFGYDIDEQGTK